MTRVISRYGGIGVFEQSRARKQFDSGMRALGFMVVGRRAPVDPIAARTFFRSAATIDPTMCDAWLGIAATGLMDSEVLAHLLRTANPNLGVELQRLHLRPDNLQIRFNTNWYVDHGVSTGNDIWAAAAAERITARDYDAALAILNSVTRPSPLIDYIRATLFVSTERWPQVLQALSDSNSWTDKFLRSGAHILTGRACARLGLFDEATRRLRLVDAAVLPKAVRDAEFILGLIAREQGDEAAARSLFEKVYVLNPGDPQVRQALEDKTFRLSRVTPETIAARTNPWDPTSSPNGSAPRTAEQERPGAAALQESKRLLSEMIGLSSVKREVDKLTASMILAKSACETVEGNPSKSRHLVFTGPPGVGKTEVARILAKMYFGLGVLATDNVIEVAPSDFFGTGYGAAEERSREIFERALDGVLFIDEAYSIYHDGIVGGDANGTKIINALLATMENHRSRLIVIVAGYETEMNTFLERNAGLRSRFAKQFRFPSYDPAELVRIASKMANFTYNATVSEDASTEIGRIAAYLCTTVEATTGGATRSLIDREGNGRFIRNLIEAAIEERDFRLVTSTDDPRSISQTARALIHRDDVVRAIAEHHSYIPVEVS